MSNAVDKILHNKRHLLLKLGTKGRQTDRQSTTANSNPKSR